MSDLRHDPYDADRPLLMRCACGRHGSEAEHVRELDRDRAAATLRKRADAMDTTDIEAESNQFVEAALVKALFPQDALRRRFLRAVGRGTRDGRDRQRAAHRARCRRWRRSAARSRRRT